MASYKNGSITLENVYGKKTYETTIAECGSSTELQELTITENGIYTAPEGTAYSPVNVNVQFEGNMFQYFINNHRGDGQPSGEDLFYEYWGSSLDDVINSCDFSRITSAKQMFYDCKNITSVPSLDIRNATTCEYMFYNCKSLLTVNEINLQKCTSMNTMFAECKKLTNISLINTGACTTANGMFQYCSSLTTIPLFDTHSIKDMGNMFGYCTSLTTIPLFDLSSCTSTRYMFQNCYSLVSLPSINTSNVLDMSNMFYECEKLEVINQLDTSSATNVSSMFKNCYKLKSIPPLTINSSASTANMFEGCYRIEKIDITRLTNSYYFAFNCGYLKKLIIRIMETIPTLNTNCFDGCYHFNGTAGGDNPQGLKDGRIYVPDDKVEELKVATNWSVYADIIVPLSTLVE